MSGLWNLSMLPMIDSPNWQRKIPIYLQRSNVVRSANVVGCSVVTTVTNGKISAHSLWALITRARDGTCKCAQPAVESDRSVSRDANDLARRPRQRRRSCAGHHAFLARLIAPAAWHGHYYLCLLICNFTLPGPKHTFHYRRDAVRKIITQLWSVIECSNMLRWKENLSWIYEYIGFSCSSPWRLYFITHLIAPNFLRRFFVIT